MAEDLEAVDHLIARFQAGIDREEAFRDLFRRFHDPVQRFFERKGFSEEESRDLTQETFLRVFGALGTFRQESRFETWLFSVTMNVYHNELRRRSAWKRGATEVPLEALESGEGLMGTALSEAVEGGAGPLERVIEKERNHALRLAIRALPVQMRRCCILRVERDLEYGEIAQVLGISIHTVKSQLHQARQRLRVELGESFDEF